MEHKSEFNLDEAIHAWRSQFFSLSDSILDELESHLRDSTSSLEKAGLAQEEAFAIAARRLGTERQIGSEYNKVHASEVWTNRAQWALAGICVWTLLLPWFWLFTISVPDVVASALKVRWLPVWSLSLSARWGCAFVLIAGVRWLCVRWGEPGLRAVKSCVGSLKSSLYLFLIAGALLALSQFGLNLMIEILKFWAGGNVQLTMQMPQSDWAYYGWTVPFFAIVSCGFAYLGRWIWGSNVDQSSGHIQVSEELDFSSRRIAMELQATGISHDEACYLALRRNGVFKSHWVSPRGAWAERLFWAISGILLYRIVMPYMTSQLDISVRNPGSDVVMHSRLVSWSWSVAVWALFVGYGIALWLNRRRAQHALRRLANLGARNALSTAVAVFLVSLFSDCLISPSVAMVASIYGSFSQIPANGWLTTNVTFGLGPLQFLPLACVFVMLLLEVQRHKVVASNG